MSNEKNPKDEQPSEEYEAFELAMKRILKVRKEDIVPMLPEMFPQ